MKTMIVLAVLIGLTGCDCSHKYLLINKLNHDNIDAEFATLADCNRQRQLYDVPRLMSCRRAR